MGNNNSSNRKQTLVAELSAIKAVQEKKPSWFGPADHARLASQWEAKSIELVNLEIASYRKRLGG